MRVSAQNRSHKLEASDMACASFSHDLISHEKPQNRDLCETTEKELFFTGVLEPGPGSF